MNHKQWRKLLERYGWTCEAGGKHGVKMVKEGQRPITLPAHKGRTYHVGLHEAIRKQAGLSSEDAEGGR
jgi:predicted RNA binding protein YcfA (HicA-like mRNA interferase family)